MTKGKNALSDMPRNQRMVISPPKFLTVTTMTVVKPKQNIMIGRTRLGPYFLPAMPRKGAVRTYGTKKTDRIMLYWSPLSLRVFSRPAVLALPRLDLSRQLKRYMTAKTGRM